MLRKVNGSLHLAMDSSARQGRRTSGGQGGFLWSSEDEGGRCLGGTQGMDEALLVGNSGCASKHSWLLKPNPPSQLLPPCFFTHRWRSSCSSGTDLLL